MPDSLPDLLVIGAGAAGIAAARTAMEAGRSVLVLEARGRPGGRALTDTARLGLPYDLGATWLHQAVTNPLVPLAVRLGVTLHDSDALRRERSQVGARPVTPAEDAAYSAAWAEAEARIAAAAPDGAPHGAPDCSLAEGMGAVEDDIDTVFPGDCGNRLHRHDQAGSMGDVGQGHQFESRITREGFAIGGQQTVETGGVLVFNLDHFDAAIACQPAHGTFDRV
ncbi:MAG: FAD-dependent oxidoreductase, partial [Roseomonas sp.]|nr:FAD-dependent oxidoreductase [Roseomonas sp.]